ncbi:hypothetical protein C0585_07225 [Candidatus Woesearchaeota archaeon]|nr:MAG: hypothetical protein C0585_07225 [Candidatus Woesearchaeota archaeon]
MGEENTQPSKKGGGVFPLFPLLKIIFSAYLIILGLGVNLPYLENIPSRFIFFISAGIIILGIFPSGNVKKFRKKLARELEK